VTILGNSCVHDTFVQWHAVGCDCGARYKWLYLLTYFFQSTAKLVESRYVTLVSHHNLVCYRQVRGITSSLLCSEHVTSSAVHLLDSCVTSPSSASCRCPATFWWSCLHSRCNQWDSTQLRSFCLQTPVISLSYCVPPHNGVLSITSCPSVRLSHTCVQLKNGKSLKVRIYYRYTYSRRQASCHIEITILFG